MTAQIPSDWHPETYAVDEFNKVVWKQGGHAVAMGLAGKTDTLIPGYTIALCTREELRGVRHRIKADEARRDEEPFTKEEEEEPQPESAGATQRSRGVAKTETGADPGRSRLPSGAEARGGRAAAATDACLCASGHSRELFQPCLQRFRAALSVACSPLMTMQQGSS